MPLSVKAPDRILQAVAAVMQREAFASELGSRDLSAVVQELDRQVFFSARTTQASYLEWLKKLVERFLQGGFNNDKPQVRIEARKMLARLGYDPQRGFAGDEALGVPPAEPGSLRDLSSEKRLDLILDTQRQLAHGLGMKTRGAARVRTYPAWELVRLETRRVPRGSEASDSPGWQQRWMKAGGPQPVTSGTKLKLIALKSDEVWSRLGDGALFDDALNTDHPPFAFRSGMGWREVSAEECAKLGIDVTQAFQPARSEEPQAGKPVPQQQPPSVGRMDPEVKARLLDELRKRPARSVTRADLAKMVMRAEG